MSENKYAGTQTEKNLQAAFAGEVPGSQQVHLLRFRS